MTPRAFVGIGLALLAGALLLIAVGQWVVGLIVAALAAGFIR